MRLLPVLLLLPVLVLAAAGCADDGAGEPADDRDAGHAAVAHLHVDGTVRMQGDMLVLTPASGDEPIEFALSPNVDLAQVRALEAAGSDARVTFEPTEEQPVADEVAPARSLEGLASVEGTVVSVDGQAIVLRGTDGEREYALDAELAGDVEHLREHADNGQPVRVYLDGSGDDERVVAYEDA